MELLVLVIYGLFPILIVIVIIKKDNYHMDELFSYGSSNHQIYLPFKEGKYDFPYNIFYKNFLVVNINSRFNYYKVWKNQSKDPSSNLLCYSPYNMFIFSRKIQSMVCRKYKYFFCIINFIYFKKNYIKFNI